ncbi:uncharacterized protein LOC5502367 [Nematostella vectensis]|uniref:uncharacterized protein LOC5502367 n=1 Tax=Nematostella vectensis TaxID=45351 RepID=UPI002076DF3B|nr:uncharacterized protein LOC5502367 [Nematostella vectensis]
MGPHAGQYIMQAPFSGIPVARGAIPCIPNVALNGVVNQTAVASTARACAISQGQSHDDEVLQEMHQLLHEAADLYTTPSHDTFSHSSTIGHLEGGNIHEYLVDLKDLPPRSSNEASETVIDSPLTDPLPDEEGGKVTSDEEEVVPAVSQGVVEATSPSQQSLYDFGECPAWLTDLLEGDDEKTVSSEATDELPLPDPNAIEELLALMDEVKSPATDSLIAPACETNHISIQAGEVDNTAAHPNNTYKFSIADCSTLEELLAPADEVSTVAEPVDSQQDFKAEPDETPLPDPSTMRELLALADGVSTAAEGSTVPVGSQQVSDAAQEDAPLPDPSTMQEILSLVGEVTSAVESGDSSSNASCVEYIEEVIEEGTVPSFTTSTVYQSPTVTAEVWFSPYTCTYMNMSAELASVFSSSVAPCPLSSTSVPEITPDGTATNQRRVRDPLSWRDYEYALRPISTLQQPPNPPQSRRIRRPEYLPQPHVSQAQLSPGGTPYMYGGPYRSALTYPVLVQQKRLDRSPCHVTMGPHAGQYIMQAPFSGIPVARGAIPCIPNVALNGVVNQTTVASAARACAICQDQSHDDEVLQEMHQLLHEAADLYTTPSHDTFSHSSTIGHLEGGSIHEYLVDLKDLPPRSSNEASETVIDSPLIDPLPIEEGGKVTSDEEEVVPAVNQGVVEATSPSQQSLYDFGECPAWLTDLLEGDDEKTVSSEATDELPLPDPHAIEELLALMAEVKSPATDSLIAPACETNHISIQAGEVDNTAAHPNNTYKFSIADCSTLEELLAPADEVSTVAEPVDSQQDFKAEPDETPLPDPSTMRELLALADEDSTATEGGPTS